MEKYYTPSEVEDLGLIPGVSRGTLSYMRYMGTGPRYVRISPRKIVYAQSAIEDFMREREQTSTRENASA